MNLRSIPSRSLPLWLLLLSSFSALGYTLLTFDVDGTLVSSGGWAESAHGRAYPHAVSTILTSDQSPIPAVPDALGREQYHGSTDGLILLRLAQATIQKSPEESADRLDELMSCMYQYIAELSDDEVGAGLTVLPGVMSNLEKLAKLKDKVFCGLVTGNVEGIARRKMKSVGIYGTGALCAPSISQIESKEWPGAENIGFLGGFGSDYCSGDIDDPARNYLDRGEQIAIAVQRCREILENTNDKYAGGSLRRVVHIGDAPADVLAAKIFSEQCRSSGDDLCVGMVAVATGSYTASELHELVGEAVEGSWEPVVLEEGMNDPGFLDACLSTRP